MGRKLCSGAEVAPITLGKGLLPQQVEAQTPTASQHPVSKATTGKNKKGEWP